MAHLFPILLNKIKTAKLRLALELSNLTSGTNISQMIITSGRYFFLIEFRDQSETTSAGNKRKKNKTSSSESTTVIAGRIPSLTHRSDKHPNNSFLSPCIRAEIHTASQSSSNVEKRLIHLSSISGRGNLQRERERETQCRFNNFPRCLFFTLLAQ